jgi:hypothetical protein
MKAQRRHELRENDLAHALGVAWDYLNDNSTQILVAVIVVGAVIVAGLFSLRSRAAALEDIWQRRSQLSYESTEVGLASLDALAAMTKDVSDERFVLTSLLEQGQQALRLTQQVSAPPDPGFNDRARDAFGQMLSRFKDSPLAIGLAHTGLATVEANAFVLDGDMAHKERFERHLTAVIDDPALNGMPLQRMALDRRNAVDATFTRTEFVYPMLEGLTDEPEISFSMPGEEAGAETSPVETGESEAGAPTYESAEPSDPPSGAETGTDGSDPSGRP